MRREHRFVAFVAALALVGVLGLTSAFGGTQEVIVGDPVFLTAGFSDVAPQNVSEVTWTYRFPKEYFGVEQLAEAANVYYERVEAQEGPEYDAVQIRWISDGTTQGPLNAFVELVTLKGSDGNVIALPTPNCVITDTRGRTFPVDIESDLSVVIKEQPRIRFFFRLSTTPPVPPVRAVVAPAAPTP